MTLFTLYPRMGQTVKIVFKNTVYNYNLKKKLLIQLHRNSPQIERELRKSFCLLLLSAQRVGIMQYL